MSLRVVASRASTSSLGWQLATSRAMLATDGRIDEDIEEAVGQVEQVSVRSESVALSVWNNDGVV